MQGFGAHKQPSPLDSRHFLSGEASMESRLQPRLAQGICTWRLTLEFNAMPSHPQYLVVGKCWSYYYEVCVCFLKGLVEKETRKYQTHVYIKSFPELRVVRFKLSSFILLNMRGNSLWFKFLAG